MSEISPINVGSVTKDYSKEDTSLVGSSINKDVRTKKVLHEISSKICVFSGIYFLVQTLVQLSEKTLERITKDRHAVTLR
jgi:hypothetical protein